MSIRKVFFCVSVCLVLVVNGVLGADKYASGSFTSYLNGTGARIQAVVHADGFMLIAGIFRNTLVWQDRQLHAVGGQDLFLMIIDEWGRPVAFHGLGGNGLDRWTDIESLSGEVFEVHAVIVENGYEQEIGFRMDGRGELFDIRRIQAVVDRTDEDELDPPHLPEMNTQTTLIINGVVDRTDEDDPNPPHLPVGELMNPEQILTINGFVDLTDEDGSDPSHQQSSGLFSLHFMDGGW